MESEKISKELQSYNKNNLSYFEKINKLIKYQEKLYDMKYKDGKFYPKKRKSHDGKRKER